MRKGRMINPEDGTVNTQCETSEQREFAAL